MFSKFASFFILYIHLLKATNWYTEYIMMYLHTPCEERQTNNKRWKYALKKEEEDGKKLIFNSEFLYSLGFVLTVYTHMWMQMVNVCVFVLTNIADFIMWNVFVPSNIASTKIHI